MGSRIDLHELLKNILGSENVYYVRPPTKGMVYPAILYNKQKAVIKRANGQNYISNWQYQLIFIDRIPDNPVIEKLMSLPFCSYDRNYVADNLQHDVFTLYY